MVEFLVDNQTVSDLQIFPDEKNGMSVLKLFDHTKTHGGKSRLREMLGNPIADLKMINRRKILIYFSGIIVVG
jgi:DNA mismatch repair ATPase MutS